MRDILPIRVVFGRCVQLGSLISIGGSQRDALKSRGWQRFLGGMISCRRHQQSSSKLLTLFSQNPGPASPWGLEGHHVVVFLAQRYMRPETAPWVRELLGSQSLKEASVWATGPSLE